MAIKRMADVRSTLCVHMCKMKGYNQELHPFDFQQDFFKFKFIQKYAKVTNAKLMITWVMIYQD